MAANDKTLTLNFKGNTQDIEARITSVKLLAETMGVTVEKALSKVNTTTGLASASMKLLGDNVKNLQEAFNRIQAKQLPLGGQLAQGLTSSAIAAPKNYLADQQARQQLAASTFGNSSRQQLSGLSQQLSLAQTTRTSGAGSIDTLALTNAQKELAVKEKLKSDLNAIEEQIKQGVITNTTQAETTRVALIAKAGKEIIALQKQVESARKAENNRQASGNNFSNQNKAILSALEQRLALESSLHVNGANHIKTIELRSAQDQLAIRQNLATQLKALEDKLRTDTTTNRLSLMSSVNSQRAALISNAEATLNSGNRALEAAQKTARLAEEAERAANSTQHLAVRVVEMIGIYRVFNTIINTVSNSLHAIPQIGIQLEATAASLTSTMNSSAGAGSAMAALDKEAERTGITIDALRTSFRTFQASTSLAGESLQSTWHMFTNINTVASALHLTTDQTNGVFLALAQIFNKTKVQSEELVKQLGNLLPGAFASFAAANRDMFKNSADLIAKMKLGVVTAHDTVEKFTTYLADRFSNAFTLASQGLNANIGRMQTSFTHLGEAIYETNRGPMLSFVKGITSITDAITADINGANKLASIFNTTLNVGIGIASAAIITFGANLKIAEVALFSVAGATKAFEASLAFISTPTAIIAGIIAIGLELKDLGKKTKDAEQAVADFYNALQKKPDTAVEKLKVEVDKDQGVKDVKAALDAINVAITERQDKIKQVGLTGGAGAALKVDKAVLEADYRTRTDLEEKLEFAREDSLKKIQEKGELGNIQALDVRAKERTRLKIAALQSEGKAIEAARLTIEEQHLGAYNDSKKLLESAPPEMLQSENFKEEISKAKDAIADYDTLWKNAGKTGLNARIKEERENSQNEFAKLQSMLDEQTLNTKDKLREDSDNYKNNVISIQAYLQEKRSLILAQADAERSLYSAMANEASHKGDTSKVTEYDAKVKEAAIKKQELLRETVTEEIAIYKEQSKIYEEQDAKLAKLQTREEDYAKLKEHLASQNFRKQLAVEDPTDTSGRGKQAEAIDLLTAAHGKLKDSSENIAAINERYNASIAKTNILVNVGQMSQLSAAFATREANLKQITELEAEYNKELQVENDLKASGNKDANLGDKQHLKITKLRDEIDNLKVSADSVGSYFANTFSQSLQQPLSNLITGATNAKQAFRSFAISVQQGIADIVAQELRSVVMKGLGGLSGILKGLIPGGASAASGAFPSTADSLTTGLLTASAKGNVYQSPSLSAYSGQIVNTPTLFKFASGAGLMGEAGPEAIMPLSRDSQGKLGVHTTGVGSGGSNGGSGINIGAMHINVQASNDSTPAQQGAIIGKAVRTQLKTLIQTQTADNLRSGKILNPTAIQVNM